MTQKHPQMPALACDSHMHVMADAEAFPYSAKSHYRPRARGLDDYFALARPLGIERVVIVQAGAYGTDNRYMLDVLRNNPDRARGIAVISPDVTDAELADMHAVGVRGIRIHVGRRTADEGDDILALFRRQAERLKPLGWHIETLARVDMIAAIGEELARLPVPVVFDHMAYTPADGGMEHPGFAVLLELLRTDRAWVKLSAANRIDKKTPDFSRAAPIQRTLLSANPNRAVWGTDWPHVVKVTDPSDPQPLAHLDPVDNTALLDLLRQTVETDAVLSRVLSSNPAELYDFPSH